MSTTLLWVCEETVRLVGAAGGEVCALNRVQAQVLLSSRNDSDHEGQGQQCRQVPHSLDGQRSHAYGHSLCRSTHPSVYPHGHDRMSLSGATLLAARFLPRLLTGRYRRRTSTFLLRFPRPLLIWSLIPASKRGSYGRMPVHGRVQESPESSNNLRTWQPTALRRSPPACWTASCRHPCRLRPGRRSWPSGAGPP